MKVQKWIYPTRIESNKNNIEVYFTKKPIFILDKYI